MEERIFHFNDAGLRFYQVKNMGHCQILVQDNTDKDVIPSVPQRITAENYTTLSPVCKGHSWSLDRCVGVINISVQESIHVDDERDYIEVRPHFDKLTPVEKAILTDVCVPVRER